MKRKVLLIFAIIAIFQPLWAAYEYGAVPFDITWHEDEKCWYCAPTSNVSADNIFDVAFVKIGEKAGTLITLKGNTGYSKVINFLHLEYCWKGNNHDMSLSKLSSSLGNSVSNMPIKIKMKNGKKLEGIATVSSSTTSLNEEHVEVKKIYLLFHIQISDMHCKGEPDPESLEHETFIAQLFATSDIESFEIGGFKQKLAPDFCTSKTLNAMLKKLAEYTNELDIYFPY